MAKIPFTKLSGCHNDFVLLDNRDGRIPGDPTQWARTLCRRRYSIGADGLLVIESDSQVQFSMCYYNADGSMADLCGNGARCAALYAYRKGIVPQEMKFRSSAGMHWAHVKTDTVQVSMPEPRDIRRDLHLSIDGQDLTGTFVHSGVPHFVSFVQNIADAAVVELGHKIRHHPQFSPEGTNADFARIQSPNRLALRTYERGVEDETLACGTGATAAAIAAHLGHGLTPPVIVDTQGNCILVVDFNFSSGTITNVSLEGEARIVFEGTFELSSSL